MNENDSVDNSEPDPGASFAAQISQLKLSAREEVIAKLVGLLSESYRKSMETSGRGGLRGRQKWFSLSSSLAFVLARLLTDLEYENLRNRVDSLKKKVQEQNVSTSRIAAAESGHRQHRKTVSQEGAPGNPN